MDEPVLNKELIEDFIIYTQNNLVFPIKQQESCGCGPIELAPRGTQPFWCCDWWTLEMAKAMYFGGLDKYIRMPIPRRLKRINYRPTQVQTSVRRKMDTLATLHAVSSNCKNLFIAEVGRGVEILIALSIKTDWERIACYDAQVKYEKYLTEFFTLDRFKGDLLFGTMSSGGIFKKVRNVDHYLGDDTIVIATEVNLKEDIIADRFDKARHIIYNGKLLK